MCILCERDEAIARLLCTKVKEFTTDLPLADRAVEFMSWKEHRCKWTESFMAGLVPGDLKRLFAVVRAASSRPPAKAKLFLKDMIQPGEDDYARRNHRLARILQLPPGDRRKATYVFLCGDTPFCPPAGGAASVEPFGQPPGRSPTAFQRAPLHALLVSRLYVTHGEAMSTFPHWMAAAVQAFSAWLEYWVAQDFATFRARPREVSTPLWTTIRGTMVRNSDGHDEPWLKVFVGHPAVGSVMGWPGDVLPVFQRPLCSLPVLAVATVLGMGKRWLYDRRLRRVIPVATGQRCMAVLVGSKQVKLIQETRHLVASRRCCCWCRMGMTMCRQKPVSH